MTIDKAIDTITADFYQTYQAHFSHETIDLAIFHSIKGWHDNNAKSGLVKEEIEQGFKLKHPHISESNPPLNLDLCTDVWEWICAYSEDYGFGNTNFSKEESVTSLIQARKDFVKAYKKPIKTLRINKEDLSLKEGLLGLLPKLNSSLPTTCHEKEVYRQLEELSSEFWDHNKEKHIPGITQLHQEFVMTVYHLSMNRNREFSQQTNNNALLTYLYLFQTIYLENGYDESECFYWAIHMQNLPKLIEGAGSIKHATFFWRNSMCNSVIGDRINNAERLISVLSDNNCCANISYQNQELTLSLWTYPNKESSLVTIICNTDNFSFEGAIKQIIKLNEIQKGQKLLLELFESKK